MPLTLPIFPFTQILQAFQTNLIREIAAINFNTERVKYYAFTPSPLPFYLTQPASIRLRARSKFYLTQIVSIRLRARSKFNTSSSDEN